MSASAPIQLRTLGPVGLTRPDGTEISSVLCQPKRLALLVYLALANRGALCRRDTVLGVFWPEFDQERARAALRKALHFLRRELGDGVIVTRGDEEVGVDPDRLRCDVWTFETAVADGDQEQALTLHHGAFLEGFHLSDSPAFEHWCDGVRAELHETAIRLAGAELQICREKGDTAGAMRCARLRTHLAPADETAARALIMLLHKTGDQAGALRAYRSLCVALQDLELEPSAETEALMELAREPVPHPTTPTSHAPLAQTPTPPTRRRGILPAGAIFAVALLGSLVFVRFTADSTSDHRPSVAVAAFENMTGDPTLDALGSIYQRGIVDGLAPMGEIRALPVGASDSAASFRITGSFHPIGSDGDSLEFLTEIEDHDRKQLLPAPDPVRISRVDPTRALERTRDRIAGAIGYYISYWAPTRPQRRPPEPDVYIAFQEALRTVLRWGDFDETRRTRADSLLRYVIDRDPSYTEAYLLLSFLMQNANSPATVHGETGQIGRYDLIDSLARVMRHQIEPLGETDQLAIQYLEALATANFWRALTILHRILPSHPELLFRAAMLGVVGNQPSRVLDVIDHLEPETAWVKEFWSYWFFRQGAHHLARDYDGELRANRAARSRGLFQRDVSIPIRALAAKGDTEGVRALTQQLTAGLALRSGLEARAHGSERDDPDLIAEGDRMLRWLAGWYDADPDNWFRRWVAHWILPFTSRVDEHLANLEVMVRERPERLDVKGMLGVTYARTGNRAAADSIDAVLAVADSANLRGLLPLWRARILAQLGRKDEAVDLLGRSLAQGTFVHPAFPAWSSYWHTDPHFEPLWGYPPYERLVAPK